MEKQNRPGGLEDPEDPDEYASPQLSDRVPVRGQRILCVDEVERSAMGGRSWMALH